MSVTLIATCAASRRIAECVNACSRSLAGAEAACSRSLAVAEAAVSETLKAFVEGVFGESSSRPSAYGVLVQRATLACVESSALKDMGVFFRVNCFCENTPERKFLQRKMLHLLL